MNFNKAIIVGNLTQDPELKTIPNSGTSVASFSVATNRYYKNQSGERQENTEFHNLVVFGNMAENASKYLKKGSLALFEGRIQTRNWEDKEGSRRYRTEIIVENMQFGPRSEGGGGDFPKKSNTSSNPSNNQEKRDIPVIDEEDEINVEDIPF